MANSAIREMMDQKYGQGNWSIEPGTQGLGRIWNDLSGITDRNKFNSAEAQKQRDWEEQMSNTAYQRQVADMKAAGINPAAAHLTSGGASVPNGAVATSAEGGSGGIVGMLAKVAGMVLAKVAGAKIMAKASSASDAATAARTVAIESMKAKNAMKLANAKYKHSKKLEAFKASELHSKAYWQEEPLDDGSFQHI